MVRWNSTNHISNIRQATPRIRFISLEPTSRIWLKNIRKCPAQSNPHERIISPVLRKKTRNTRFDRPENKTRKRQFHSQIYKIVHGLEKVNWCDGNKTLRPEKNKTDLKHQFQFYRERTSGNEHTLPSQQNSNPLLKDIALANLVNSFKS